MPESHAHKLQMALLFQRHATSRGVLRMLDGTADGLKSNSRTRCGAMYNDCRLVDRCGHFVFVPHNAAWDCLSRVARLGR